MCIAAQRWAPWAWGMLVGHRGGCRGRLHGGWGLGRSPRAGARGRCWGSHGVGAGGITLVMEVHTVSGTSVRSVTDEPNYINTVNLYLPVIHSHPGLSPKGQGNHRLYSALPEHRRQSPSLSHILQTSQAPQALGLAFLSQAKPLPPDPGASPASQTPSPTPPFTQAQQAPACLHSTTPTPSQVGAGSKAAQPVCSSH